MANKTYNIIFIVILVIILSLLIIYTPTCATRSLSLKEGLDATEFITTPKTLLFQDPIPLKQNLAVTFTMKLNSGFNGSWQQIIGVTPYQNANDARVFGAWLCPSSNTVHFRIATQSNWNDNITDCNIQVPLNEYVRFDTVINTMDNNTQNVEVYMTNLSRNSATTQVVGINLPPAKLTPGNGYTQAWVFTSYNNFGVFNGTLKNVAVTSGDTLMSIDNLKNATNFGVALVSGFTTMSGESIKEGIANIGGIGNNGGIGYIPPSTVNLPIQNATNYVPIKDSSGKDLCTRTVARADDKNIGMISSNGYNYSVNIGSDLKNSGSVPICSPDELYTIQTQILNEINNFNAEYSDFVTYKYNTKHSISGDTTPQLKYANGSTDNTPYAGRFSGINTVQDLPKYQTLIKDIQTYNNLLVANKAYYPEPEDAKDPNTGLSKLDPIYLNLKHIDVKNLRNDLDTKLFELNNIQNSVEGSSKMQMDSSIYVTILWTTLATSLIYFMFV